MEIPGRTALITGGAHRVGRAITLALAEAGSNVVINYRSSASAAEETVAQAEALGVKALAVQADVGDLAQTQALVAAAKDRFGTLTILINSASPFTRTPFPMSDYAEWHRVTAVLLDGPLYLSNAIAPMMLEQGEGAIVNIVDLSAWQPWPGFLAHSVGKAGLMAMTRQLALELAPEVQVNAIAPGPVLPPPGYSQERTELVAGRTLKGRWGTPQDVTDAVLYLIQANYITGEVLVVDGGERFGHHRPRQ